MSGLPLLERLLVLSAGAVGPLSPRVRCASALLQRSGGGGLPDLGVTGTLHWLCPAAPRQVPVVCS